MASKVSKDKEIIDTLHDYGIHIPTRTIWLESSQGDEGGEDGVNYSMFVTFHKNMSLLEHISSEPITIIMNTGGGVVTDGMAIYDTIRASSCDITIKVVGIAMSMGCIVLQSADHRVLTPNARVMFHLGSGHSHGNHIYEAYNAVADDIKQAKKIDLIMFNRMKQKKGDKFTMKKYKELDYNGKFMDAEEAIAMGLADEIEYPPD